MPSSLALSNAIVMNKYIWMSRQLRNFNDVGSIIHWANAMIYVKNLLLIMVIRAQILKKNAQMFIFNAQAKMLSFKIMLRLKCTDENKCSDKNADEIKCSDKNALLKKMLR